MDVYWSVYKNFKVDYCVPMAHYLEPSNLFEERAAANLNVSSKKEDFRYCPAYKEAIKNTFILKFPFDYFIQFSEDGKIKNHSYDRRFLDTMVLHRSNIPISCSFALNYIFFCEQSLEMQMTGAHFSVNDFVNKTMIIPGKFDIGKWFRNLDCAFIMKGNNRTLNINRGDDYCYVNFLTDEKVTLKKFYMSNTIMELSNSLLNYRNYQKRSFLPLIDRYNTYKNSKFSKLIFSEIQNNLMD